MKTQFFIFMIAATIIAATSCYKYPSNTEFLDERDVVLTMYDVKTDFTGFKTYSIVDSIGIIKNDTVVERKANDTTRAVLDRIIQHMDNRGFTRVTKDQNPDLAINVVVLYVIHQYGYPGWWWGYPGYFPPDYWGYYDWLYYYPWYPVYVFQYETGTLIIDLADLRNGNSVGKTLAVVFNAGIRAILNGRHTLNQVLGDIDQAFIQTPQIQTN